MKPLIICEKPSATQIVANALGDKVIHKTKEYFETSKYYFTYNFGHLFELKMPNEYPELADKDRLSFKKPERWKLKIKKGCSTQFNAIKQLMNSPNVSFIINCGDAGREGELIFRYTYLMSGSKKEVKRMWLSSMEDSAIRKEINNLKPSRQYDNLFSCALARQYADWLVGMNASGYYYGSVGRVRTPTLQLIIDRENEIANFVSKTYYKLNALLNKENNVIANSETSIEDKAQAIKLSQIIKSLKVKDVKQENKSVNSPQLLDLTSLQRDCNKAYGFTASKTLSVLQTLYERKLTTYPRTDSRYLTNDMGDELANRVRDFKHIIGKDSLITSNIKKNLNSSKVGDHYAIITTVNLNSGSYAKLNSDEKAIINMIGVSMIKATMLPYKYIEQVATFYTNNGIDFKCVQNKIVDLGFRAVDKNKPNGVSTFFNFIKDKEYPILKMDMVEGKTQPPSHFTEATLLTAMEKAGSKETDKDAERKGMGTPATRSGIIEEMISKGLMERNKKMLLPTAKGISLNKRVNEKIKSPLLTAEFENKLLLISRGEYSRDAFLKEIEELLDKCLQEAKANPIKFESNGFNNNFKKKSFSKKPFKKFKKWKQ